MRHGKLLLLVLLTIPTRMAAASYYIAPNGNDANDGKTYYSPFATLGAAQAAAEAGDSILILPGTYHVTEQEIMGEEKNGPYKIIFHLNKSGEPGKPISYVGVPDEDTGQRPVFDLSAVNPTGYRITGFLVSGQFLVLKDFEVTGIQVNITTHTQSENIRVTNGSYNTFENIACHDGMGVGFYLTRQSSHNLFINCDGYNNYDPISEVQEKTGSGMGGNNDGFGCHVEEGQLENHFIGCRAWNNSDDGYDLINCYSPVTFSYCIAYHNGYDAEGISRQDGNGFKAGGYGMEKEVRLPSEGTPTHQVENSISALNRSNGFYANHHLGGIRFNRNTAYRNNSYNYNLVNRQGTSLDEAIDVNGYGHLLVRNLSIVSSGKTNHVTWLNGGDGKNAVLENSFYWVNKNSGGWAYDDYGNSIFESTTTSNLILPRETDGTLTDLTLSVLRQRTYVGMGCSFDGYQEAIAEARTVTGAHATGSGSATAIKTIGVVRQVSDQFYDLQGRRVDRPNQGIYIRNGRKVIIK